MKRNIKALDIEEIKRVVEDMGLEPYRASQIFKWIWDKGIEDFSEMTDIKKSVREELAENFSIKGLEPVKVKSSKDGARKFLFRLEDGNLIETVYIPDGKRDTVCVSTQVGCPLKCKICYTGKKGFKRNLKFYEIADQVVKVKKLLGKGITNVVLMGMGEPLLNYDESLRAIKIINSQIGIGARKITLSTAGVIPEIYRLSDFPLQIKLAVSLNATDDSTRDMLMPINRRYPLKELLKAVRFFTQKRRKRVTFEYVVIKGINDRREDIERLPELLSGIPCKINLIPFNPFPGTRFKPPSKKGLSRLLKSWYPRLPCITIRDSKGSDILAGCGQLAGDGIH